MASVGIVVAYRADAAPDAFSSMLQQRPGSQGASAASRIADVLCMAQAAVRKQRHRAAATPAPTIIRAGGARGDAMRGGFASSAAGRMSGGHALLSRRAKSAGAARQHCIATSPFVTAGAIPAVVVAIVLGSFPDHAQVSAAHGYDISAAVSR